MLPTDERIQLSVSCFLGQVAAELRQHGAFLRAIGQQLLGLDPGQLFTNGGEAQAALVQDLCRKALLFAQQAEQQVLRPYVFVRKPLRLFRRIGQHALALVAERQVNRCRDLFANRRMGLDLLADGVDRGVRPEEPVR